MNRKCALWILALAVAGTAGCVAYVESPPPGEPSWHRAPEVEVSFFHDALAPYGDWVRVEPWGSVWAPRDVGPGWRPYTDGHWVWTSDGWAWISDYAWGWAPFHYGRWAYDSYFGWIWIPDTVWAPAWVAWRTGNGWIGWAPLPPQARWRFGFGLDLGGVDLVIVDHGWCFLDERDFLDRRIRHRLAPLPRNRHLLRDTRDVTRYEERDRRVAVRSIDVKEVEERTGPVPRYKIEDLERPPRDTDPIRGEAVRIYRPEVKPEEPEGKSTPARPAPVVKESEPPATKEPKGRPEKELLDNRDRQAKERAKEQAKEPPRAPEKAKTAEPKRPPKGKQPPQAETQPETKEAPPSQRKG